MRASEEEVVYHDYDGKVYVPAIRELLFLNRSPRRYMALFRFYCDESYDSDPHQDASRILSKARKPHVPQTYVVGGFFSHGDMWDKVEQQWNAKNERVHVKRFHASHLNARAGEFEGWSKNRQMRYAKDMLSIIKRKGTSIFAVSCGMFAREYERIISPAGRERLGHPYIACFKACVTLIAQGMDHESFGPDDTFSVILDQNDFQTEAVDVFYKLKATEEWPYSRRLETCTPGSSAVVAALQTADLIAYDSFRLLHGKHRSVARARRSLESMYSKNVFMGVYYEKETLESLKEALGASTCVKNGFIPIFSI
jgi:hypothetical protein